MALTKVTGQVIKNTTDVTVGVLTVTNTLAVGGTVSIGGTLTYEDVTNVDAVGLITARNGIVVGSGITLSKDGDIFATGVTTTGSLVSNGAISGTTGTFTGDVSIPDTIVHTGDTNTKIRFPAADTVSIETAGSERVRITSDGDVGIGVNDPDAKLEVLEDVYVKGSSGDGSVGIQIRSGSSALSNQHQIRTGGGSGDQLFIEALGGSSAIVTKVAGSERLRITSDGKLGLGVASPQAVMHIEGGSEGNLLQLSNTNTGSTNSDGFVFGINSSLTYLYNRENKDITFGTNNTERVRILSTGEVGIGIDAPAKTGIQNNVKVLQIDGGDGAELILGNSTSSNVSVNHIGAIAFKNIDTSTGNAPHYAGIRCNCVDTSGNMNLKFYTGTTNFEADSPDMLIDGTGKVGIGENSPDALLHLSTGASTTCELRLQANNTGSGAGDRGRINVYSALNDGTAYQAGHVDIDRSSGTDDIAHLLVALNDGSSVAERLRITGAGDLKFNSGFGSVATAFGCRAWVYINNTSGNMSLSGNGNVSSVSDLGAGAGRVTFTNAMTDTTYCVVSGLRRQGTHDMLNVNFSNSTGNFRFDSFSNASSSNADLQGYAFAVFR